MNALFTQYMKRMPLVAILRGITPDEAIEVVHCLLESGIYIVEVPLNSPDAFDSIRLISQNYSDQMLVGAGTVLSSEQVKKVFEAGGQLIVSPNVDIETIKTTVELGMVSLPGIATLTEAFNALDAGASGLKAFPAEMMPPSVIKSLRAVLPKDLNVLPVGGINSGNVGSYLKAGASGFGVGGEIYQPSKSIERIRDSALGMVDMMNSLIIA